MDWPTFFETYSESLFPLGGVCVGIIASFIGLIIGYFVQKWNDDRKRNWELDDRAFNRRAAIHDMRIQEARYFVDEYSDIVQKIADLEYSIMGKGWNTMMVDPDPFESNSETHREIVRLLRDTAKKRISILILKDEELNEKLNIITSGVFEELTNIPELVKRFAIGEPFEDDKEEDIKRIKDFQSRTNAFIQVMHARIDELAQKVP